MSLGLFFQRKDLILSNPHLPNKDSGSSLLLEVKNLSRNFGGLRAVSDVTFHLHANEIVGLIGPNGAGKTTVFALLSGFLSPSQGDIRFLKTSVVGLPPHRICHLGIARTFQIVRPFAELTVYDNLKAAAVFGKPQRPRPSELEKEIGEILEETGLSAKADRLAGSLSLPERKRLEVARTLATRPKLLLLDEVLAGLNPREVEEAIPLIRSLNVQRKIAILMIEHNMKAIMGISHRLLVINFGKLIFDGPPQKAAEDPEVIRAYLGEKEDA